MRSSIWTQQALFLRFVLLAIICRWVVVSSSHFKSGSRSVSTITELHGGAGSSTTTSKEKANNHSGFTDVDLTVNVSSTTTTYDDAVSVSLSNQEETESDDDDDESDNTQESKRRKKFLNRIAKVSTLLLRREHDATLADEEDALEMHDDAWGNQVTPQSDLTRPGRHVHIVTTASLPWFTGTAVNPLLRAAYLHQRLKSINSQANTTTHKGSYVTLIIPWLELPEDQEKIYNGHIFDDPQEQEAYVRDWLRNQAGLPDAADELNLHFYNARYHSGLGSVFAMGDIIQQLPQDELDVCVLEEPEQ